MMQSAEAETHCTAVERALEYCDLKPEDKFNMTMKTRMIVLYRTLFYGFKIMPNYKRPRYYKR